MGVRRPRVRADGQRHRGARRGLSNDESPAGQVAPEWAEALTSVHVRAARSRISRREPGRGHCIAVRDDRSDTEADQKSGSRSRGGRRKRGEDSGADHRAQADHDRVAQAEAPSQPGLSHQIVPSADGHVAHGGILLAHFGRGRRTHPDTLVARPRGRRGLTGKHPGRLACGPSATYSPGGGTTTSRPSTSAATCWTAAERAAPPTRMNRSRPDALHQQRVHGVGEKAYQTFDAGPGQMCAGRVPQGAARAARRARRAGSGVRSPSRYGTNTRPSAPAGPRAPAGQLVDGRRRACVGGRVEHPGRVQRADQRQERAGCGGEAGDDAAWVSASASR